MVGAYFRLLNPANTCSFSRIPTSDISPTIMSLLLYIAYFRGCPLLAYKEHEKPQ